MVKGGEPVATTVPIYDEKGSLDAKVMVAKGDNVGHERKKEKNKEGIEERK